MRLHRSAWVCFVALMSCSGNQSGGATGGSGASGGSGGTTATTDTTATSAADAATAPESADAATVATADDASVNATGDAALASTGDASGPTVAWATMTHEQKMDYMAHTVMPEMRQMFQAHDAQRFARFSCATCHGPNAREVNFHMPNGIAPLDPARIPAMFTSHGAMPVFMTQHVWPRMTALLGAQPYNPETHQGFGCLGCHGTRTAGAAPAAAHSPAAAPAAVRH